MTTPNIEELIAYLRGFFIDENVTAVKANQIADLLQSQAERIKVLESECLNSDIRLATVIEQREKLRAQLAEIAATEPVGKVVSSGPANLPVFQWLSVDHSLRCNIGDELFTRPMPAQQPIGYTHKDELKHLAAGGASATFDPESAKLKLRLRTFIWTKP